MTFNKKLSKTRIIHGSNYIKKSKTEQSEQLATLITKYLGRICHVATINNKVIATCGLNPSDGEDFYKIGLTDYYEVSIIVVDENFRGQALATKLLKLACQKTTKSILCEAWGCNGIKAHADSVLRCNHFQLIKKMPLFYYKNRGDCSFCVNRNACCENLCTCDIYVLKK